MDGEFLVIAASAFILVACAIGAMAIGVIFRRPCLKGSCGGAGACPDCPNRTRQSGPVRRNFRRIL